MQKSLVVVVTGSSSGIGLHLCLHLARKKHTIIATMRTPASAPPSLRECCDVQPLDVTDEASANQLCEYLRRRYGGCDVLVNNAGFGLPGTLETVAIERAKQVFEVNVWGVVRMCQLAVPLMRERGGGLVVTVSSTSGWRAVPGAEVYAGSKFAIEGMMESFRYAVQRDNIKVCIVNPGPTDTGFVGRFERELQDGSRKGAPETMLDFARFYVEQLKERIGGGQGVGECAQEISKVVEREWGKKIDDAGARATFWNPTAEYGRMVLAETKVWSDGASGPIYEKLFQESYEVLEKGAKTGRNKNRAGWA